MNSRHPTTKGDSRNEKTGIPQAAVFHLRELRSCDGASHYELSIGSELTQDLMDDMVYWAL